VSEVDFTSAYFFEGDPEHLAILLGGVEAWNAWRRENEDVEPQLSGANLSEHDLGEANLSRADLSRAQLIWPTSPRPGSPRPS
jgi:uncharacterized protein YjbI with pentapeptide repeats